MLNLFNLLKRPIETETLDAWAKIAADITKVAILAFPVILYGNDPIYLKIINTVLLVFAVYFGLAGTRHLRRIKLSKKEEKQ